MLLKKKKMSSIFNDKSILSFSKPVSYKRQDILTLREHLGSPRLFSGVRVANLFFYVPATKSRGAYYFTPVRPSVRPSIRPSVRSSVCPSGYRNMVCSAILSYSFGATALMFCRMFIHIMEVCISTGF